MNTIHIFESAEDLYDCISGCDPFWSVPFESKELAEEWFSLEFGEEYYFAHDDELKKQRVLFAQAG